MDTKLLIDADDLYVYGTDMRAGPGALVRWPIAGGEGQVMAAGAGYFFEGDAPLVVDHDYLYFIARTGSSELTSSLGGLAINSTALFIVEYASQALTTPIAARRIDKTSLQVTSIADQDRLLDASLPRIFANDTYFVTTTTGGFQRFELANLEMTPLATGWPTQPSLLGNEIYFSYNGTVRRLDLAAARSDDLLTFYLARNVLASGAWIFAQVQTEGADWSIVRIDRE